MAKSRPSASGFEIYSPKMAPITHETVQNK